MTALLDVKAAARYLGIGFSTLNKARVSGAGPKYSKILGRVMYRVEDLDRFVIQNQHKSTAEEKAA